MDGLEIFVGCELSVFAIVSVERVIGKPEFK